VARNRKMRFISLFFGQTNRNMVTRLKYGRDVPPQFQASPGGPMLLPGAGKRDRRADKRLCTGNIWN
jgi:hypothetical protein